MRKWFLALAAVAIAACDGSDICIGFQCDVEIVNLQASPEGNSYHISGGSVVVLREQGITEVRYEDESGTGSLFDITEPDTCGDRSFPRAKFVGTATITVVGAPDGFLRVCGQ